MSLTQVVPRLTARGLKIDTCSWYPWLHEEKHAQGICLGMDSLAIFDIGGDVRCELEWGFCKIEELTRKAAVPCTPQSLPCRPQSRQMPELHTYSGNDQPGQVWTWFKSKHNEKPEEADLQKQLRNLLQPSTDEARLEEIETKYRATHPRSPLRAYLRLRQKPLNQNESFVYQKTGLMHNGSHRSASWWSRGGHGESWWMSASSSTQLEKLEKREAPAIATLSVRNRTAVQKAVVAVHIFDELALDNRDAEPSDEHSQSRPQSRPQSRHWEDHNGGGDKWWRWSDWDWDTHHNGGGAQWWSWKDDQSWRGSFIH